MGRQESVDPTTFAAAPGPAGASRPTSQPAQTAQRPAERLPRQTATLGALLVVPTPPAAMAASSAKTAGMRVSDQTGATPWQRLWRTAWRNEEPPSPLPNGSYVYPINHRVVTIGRALTNAVTLLDTTVSREHAFLYWRDDGWWIENIAEQNPLWVGDRLIPPGEQTPILPGELLRLGHTRLRLLAPQRSPRPPSAHVDDDAQTQPIPALPASASAMTLDAVKTSDRPDSRGAPNVSGVYVVAPGASGTGLFSPGVTLQFALGERLTPSARWALGVLCLAVFLVSALLTLGVIALVGQDALAASGLPLMARSLLGVALVAALQAANASVTEEMIKGVGLLLLLLALRDEFDNVTDGLIYGALIGAGFAMVENIVYFAATPRADLGFVIVGRVALGWLSHSTFTALFGAGLGYARETRRRRWQWLAPIAGLAAAILLHTCFDFMAFAADGLAQSHTPLASHPTLLTLATLLAEYGPLFLTQLVLLRVALRALRREAAIVRAFLADEVTRGVVTPDEYVVLQDATLRGAAERHYGLTYGPRGYLTARALYQTTTGLAFRKWHVAMGDPAKRGPQQPEDAYRRRIPRLRRSLERQVVARLAVDTNN